MADYNVKQISELLNVDSETVRRWIRNEKLKGTRDSKKTGFVVSESELVRFLNGIPKYSGIATSLFAAAVPAIGVPIAVGTLLGSLASNFFVDKDKKITTNYVINYIQNEISKTNLAISQKQSTIQQLQSEVEDNIKYVETLRLLLENPEFLQSSNTTNEK